MDFQCAAVCAAQGVGLVSALFINVFTLLYGSWDFKNL